MAKPSSPSHQPSPPSDTITILTTLAGYTASKRFVGTPTGIVKYGYNAGYLFEVFEPYRLSNITDLSELLTVLERMPNCLVIRGAPRDPGHVGNWVRRTGSGIEGNFHTPPDGRRWVLFDFDKIDTPNRLSLKKDAVAVCEYLIGLLPAEFRNAAYHWTMSSSAGMGDPTKVSMHLWFWLKAPIPDEALKTWAKGVNERAGFKLVDPALFQHVQAHYTARPIFEGMDDPFPERSGLVTKASGSVDLVPPAAIERPARQASQEPSKPSAASGFEAKLALIGDHPGGEGFHGPIVAAVASYVATHGDEGTDREVLYQTVRESVLGADASHHDRAYVEHMASREHIMPAIESALRKFGARKPKLHTDCAPHFASDPVSVEEATQRLDDLAKRI